MFNDLKKSKSNVTQEVQYFTGLSPVKIVAINPTHEELIELTGNKNIPETMATYSRRINQYSNVEEMPLVIWFSIPNGNVFNFTLNIADAAAQSKNGKVKFMNDYGKITSYIDNIEVISNNPKMSWFSTTNVKQLNYGEAELYTLLKQLYKYDEKESGFLTQMLEAKITSEDLFSGKRESWNNLKAFLELCKDDVVVLPLVVKESVDDEGKVKLRQEILVNIDLIFRSNGKVTDGMINIFKKVTEEYERATDKPITQKHYFIGEVKPFVKEANDSPTVNSPKSANNDLSWLTNL